MDYVDLGKRIHRRRVALKWTQARLAEKVNVSTSFVGHVERGSRKASLETLVSLANALGVSLDYLLSASLDNSGEFGPSPQGLSPKQRDAMREMLDTLKSQLEGWNELSDS